MGEAERDFIVSLRARYILFEEGARKRQQEEYGALERARKAHRVQNNLVEPPFTFEQLMQRGRVPRPPAPPDRRLF